MQGEQQRGEEEECLFHKVIGKVSRMVCKVRTVPERQAACQVQQGSGCRIWLMGFSRVPEQEAAPQRHAQILFSLAE